MNKLMNLACGGDLNIARSFLNYFVNKFSKPP
jgi:hypothetical protein